MQGGAVAGGSQQSSALDALSLADMGARLSHRPMLREIGQYVNLRINLDRSLDGERLLFYLALFFFGFVHSTFFLSLSSWREVQDRV